MIQKAAIRWLLVAASFAIAVPGFSADDEQTRHNQLRSTLPNLLVVKTLVDERGREIRAEVTGIYQAVPLPTPSFNDGAARRIADQAEQVGGWQRVLPDAAVRAPEPVHRLFTRHESGNANFWHRWRWYYPYYPHYGVYGYGTYPYYSYPSYYGYYYGGYAYPYTYYPYSYYSYPYRYSYYYSPYYY